MGVMIESHLVEGNQKLSADKSSLTYGQSVTDACISLETTAALLAELAASVARARFN
jgi:3-deoxy-7-phosphoheptulonate synthase